MSNCYFNNFSGSESILCSIINNIKDRLRVDYAFNDQIINLGYFLNTSTAVWHPSALMSAEASHLITDLKS